MKQENKDNVKISPMVFYAAFTAMLFCGFASFLFVIGAVGCIQNDYPINAIKMSVFFAASLGVMTFVFYIIAKKSFVKYEEEFTKDEKVSYMED